MDLESRGATKIKEYQERQKTVLLLEPTSLLQEHFSAHRAAEISLATMVTTRNHGSQQNNRGDSAAALAEMKMELELIRNRHAKDLARHVNALNKLREENERFRQRFDKEERERTPREDPLEGEGS